MRISKKISLDKIALGPAATEQDIQNYSQNQNLNSLDYFGESSQKETQIQETQETIEQEDVVATVNGKAISQEEYDENLDAYKKW